MFKTTISACALFAATSLAKDAQQPLVQHMLAASINEDLSTEIPLEATNLASGKRQFARAPTPSTAEATESKKKTLIKRSDETRVTKTSVPLKTSGGARNYGRKDPEVKKLNFDCIIDPKAAGCSPAKGTWGKQQKFEPTKKGQLATAISSSTKVNNKIVQKNTRFNNQQGPNPMKRGKIQVHTEISSQMPSMSKSFETFGTPQWKASGFGTKTKKFTMPGGGGVSPSMAGNVGQLITYIIDTVVNATGVATNDPKVHAAVMALKATTSILFQRIVQEEAQALARKQKFQSNQWNNLQVSGDALSQAISFARSHGPPKGNL